MTGDAWADGNTPCMEHEALRKRQWARQVYCGRSRTTTPESNGTWVCAFGNEA
jgi:hypothetical protein